MIKGLVIGKFYPLHKGHTALIEFAAGQCDELIVLLCAAPSETINGETRLQWLEKEFSNNSKIKPILLPYDENELPNTSISSEAVSEIWAAKINSLFPAVNIVFSSEPYGDYLAGFMHCRHIAYDPDRTHFNISATEIRRNPFKYWDAIAKSAQPYFVKKICLCGTESTGKSTLTEKLAQHYHTLFVPEMARDIVEATSTCTPEHLQQIAILHASTIIEKIKEARCLLFIDTDINITRSYSRYLFNEELETDSWIETANHCDLYLFLDKDAPHIQDGTRLDKEYRDQLHLSHLQELQRRNISYEFISGNWEERFLKAVSVIERRIIART